MSWVLAAYVVTAVTLLGYVLHLRSARSAALRDLQRRG